MQRPVMNPDLFDGNAHVDADTPNPSERRRIVRLMLAAVGRALRLGFKFLTTSPFARKRFRVEDGTPMSRFVRAVMYRLAFVPVFLAATACAVVWTATHPRSACADIDPDNQELYYQPVTFLGADNIPLEAWLVPVLEARTIIQEKDHALRKKYPAVVLVHDLGQRRQ